MSQAKKMVINSIIIFLISGLVTKLADKVCLSQSSQLLVTLLQRVKQAGK